jgi:hypothetical protein
MVFRMSDNNTMFVKRLIATKLFTIFNITIQMHQLPFQKVCSKNWILQRRNFRAQHIWVVILVDFYFFQ